MKKNQQLSAQVAEEFLAQNYAFLKNILNGKVEFKDIQKESEYRVFTKEALNWSIWTLCQNGTARTV